MHIFIGYGGSRAEDVAKKLEVYLQREGRANTFLALPSSRSLLSTDDFKVEINKNLLDCNIAVFVCHKYTSRSREVNREIDLLFEENQEGKIISFATSDTCLPEKLKERWHPLHFPPEKPEESFCRLLNEIYRCYIKIQEGAQIVSEETPMGVR